MASIGEPVHGLGTSCAATVVVEVVVVLGGCAPTSVLRPRKACSSAPEKPLNVDRMTVVTWLLSWPSLCSTWTVSESSAETNTASRRRLPPGVDKEFSHICHLAILFLPFPVGYHHELPLQKQ